MAVVKKTVAAAKAEAPKAEVKKAAPTTPVKTENATAVKEAEKAPVAKEEEKAPEKASAKEPVKAEAKKPAARKRTAKKETVKKETAKKAAPAKKPGAGKAELKSEISVQFGGKSYSQEDLMKIARDVWKYDLKQKAADLTSVELYVKPEENMVYYVMNKETTGSFYI